MITTKCVSASSKGSGSPVTSIYTRIDNEVQTRRCLLGHHCMD